MSLRYVSLASGSRGNAALVESGATLLMLDCGLTRETVIERMAAVGREPRDLTAILVTHEHSDHATGVVPLATQYHLPVYATVGTAGASRLRHLSTLTTLSCHRGLRIGGIDVEPFPVPHDAREPCQFVFRAGGRKLASVTDAGHVTRFMLERLEGCDGLALEANHDSELLQRGPYPASVKRRVASRYGHLDNAAACALLRETQHPGLQWIIALHLSEQNNSTGHVESALGAAWAGAAQRFHLASQHAPSPWLEIE
jgi:phosphoribosyl 1,2-cyclic phosphodiesterase